MTFFRDILTGTSNLEYEISRVLSLAAVASYIAYSGFHLFVNKTFDPLNYGAGFGLKTSAVNLQPILLRIPSQAM